MAIDINVSNEIVEINETSQVVEITASSGIIEYDPVNLVTNVRNQTGSSIGKFKVVYISGATGNKPLVTLASNLTEAASSKTYGVTRDVIANNGTGYVVTVGELRDVDTSAFNEGDQLWLGTSGNVITAPPAEPAHSVFIGFIIRSHPTQGVVDVRIQNGYELDELHGVQITSPTNGQVLKYNSATGLWVNGTDSSDNIYTANGTLSGARTVTLGGNNLTFSGGTTSTVVHNSGRLLLGGASDNASFVLNATGSANISTNLNVGTRIDATTIIASINVQGFLVRATNYFSLGLISSISAPSVGSGFIFAKSSDKKLYWINSDGIEYDLTDAGTNIYTADGTLTGNRTVTMGTYTLSFQRDLLINGNRIGKGNGNVSGNIVFGEDPAPSMSGGANIIIGQYGGNALTSGQFNTVIGHQGAQLITTGEFNTLIGSDLVASSLTTGTNNTALGAGSLRNTSTGTYNVSIGKQTTGGTGSYNTIIGTNVGLSGAGSFVDKNTVLGANVTIGTNKSNNIVLADGDGNMRLVFDNNGNAYLGGTTTYPTFAGYKLDVAGTTRFQGNSLINGNLSITGTGFPSNIKIETASNIAGYLGIKEGTGGFQSGASGYVSITSGGTNRITLNYGTNGNYADLLGSSLSAARTYTLPDASGTLALTSNLSGFVSGTGASGQVAYWSGTNTQTGSNNLFWDSANNRLGIGTNTPVSTIESASNTLAEISSRVGNDAPNLAGSFLVRKSRGTITSPTAVQSGDRLGGFFFSGYNGTTYVNPTALIGYAGENLTGSVNGGYFGFETTANGGTTRSEKLRILGNGNVIIQNGGTFTDGGQRLQVQGDAFIKGSGNTSATTALTVQNSDGNSLFRVLNNGWLRIGSSSTNPLIFPQTNSGGAESISGTNLSFYSYTGSQSASSGRFWFGGENMIQTTGATYNIYSRASFVPTSGTALFADIYINPIINQTGGANGITRGLYVNPTLTAAADWRSIEWSNNSGWGLYGAGTANNYLNGDTAIGTTTIGTATKLTVGGSKTAASAIARGALINTTLTAAANNDWLVGLDVNPTFNLGAFTGTTSLGLRVLNNVAFGAVGTGMYWDNANNRLGIGTNTPVSPLHINDESSQNPLEFYKFNSSPTLAGGFFASRARGTAASPSAVLADDRLLGIIARGYRTSGGNAYNSYSAGILFLASENYTSTANGSYMSFEVCTNGSTSRTERIRLFNTGNVLIQNGGTFTDGGFLLDVNGTARVQGDFTLSDTRNIIIGTTTGTKIGTSTSQKLSLWNATPDVQPTTAITAAAFVANTSGIVDDTATFGGYTMGQIVAALKRIGVLA